LCCQLVVSLFNPKEISIDIACAASCNIESVIMSRLLVVVVCCSLLAAADKGRKTPEPLPNEFVIGRDTFFDFGPPFDYLEVIAVAPDGNGTSISRIVVTPPGDACTQPVQIEVKEAIIAQSVSDLLQGNNPCLIPAAELRKEQKRCKHCLMFRGADITMRLLCSGVPRLLRMDILDRDIYNPLHAKTPEQTSWTIGLLARLDTALGPGPMDKPIFATPDPIPPPSAETSPLHELATGQFDELFPRAKFTLSGQYRQALHPISPPSVYVVSSEPMPSTSDVPQYPPLARAAHVSGRVQFTAEVGPDGQAVSIHVEGHPLLRKSVEAAVAAWTYPKTGAGTAISGVIEFRNNCTSQVRP
jgi:Gram-negative bacterial TonB protein C-terminal